MAANNWRELLRHDEVEDVVTRAIRACRGSGSITALDRVEDFESFAWDQAVLLAEKYDGPPGQRFLGYLFHGIVTYGPIKHHYLTYGRPEGPRYHAVKHMASIDAYRDQDGGDTRLDGAPSVFGSTGSSFRRLTRDDPLAILLRVERYERAVQQAEVRAKYATAFVAESNPSPYCREPTCLKAVETAGYCNPHYRRHRAHWGNSDGTSEECVEQDCAKIAVTRGYCHTHYLAELKRRKATGDLWVDPEPTCSEPGCDRPHKALGLCRNHYRRQREANAPLCAVPGCANRVRSKDLCSTHYKRERRHGGMPHGRA